MLLLFALLLTPGDDGIERDDIAELVRNAQKGDSDAFSVLAETYEKYVYNTAVRVLSGSGRNLSLAEDIAQNSLIKAWRKIGSFRGDCRFSTWLFRITVNTARDAIRAEARRKTVSMTKDDDDDEDALEEWDVPVTSGDEVPESALERKETILAVRRAIEELPEDQRKIVIMRDINDLPYQVISETLGVELGTVKSRLNRARANLKKILENGNIL